MSETPNTPSQGEPAPSQEAPNTAQDTSTKSLDESLQRAQRQLALAQKRLSRSTILTTIVGAILLILLGVYFVVGYSALSDLMEPETLVGASVEYLERGLPEARAALEAEVDASATTWAEQLSAEAVANLPVLREKIEEKALEETDGLLENAAVMTSQQFRAILRDHRPLLEKGFEEIGTDQKLSKESLDALEKVLEKELKADIEDQSQIVLETLMTLTTRLRKLAKGKNLDAEEQLYRQILMGTRRLQLQEADPEFAKQPTPKATTGPRDGEAAKDDTGKSDSDEKAEPQSTEKSKPKSNP